MSISHCKAGEIIRFTRDGVSKHQYWRWDEIPSSSATEEELLRLAYEAFVAAIARRSQSDTNAIAFLSGGLDSRCIVSILHSQGVKMHTFNFAVEDQQDQFISAQFAKKLGAIHTQASWKEDTSLGMLLREKVDELKYENKWDVDRSVMEWLSEDGAFGQSITY